MRLIINGREQEAPEGATLADLVERLGLSQSACAAEVNQELVPRRQHAERRLAEGDHVELVTLVGGG
jgi:thiamine biosynthesis protein ThiS